MPDQQPVRIDVVSDVVCPWCFIGKHRLEQAIALTPDIPVEVLALGGSPGHVLGGTIPRR